jgi:hypothetical protein
MSTVRPQHLQGDAAFIRERAFLRFIGSLHPGCRSESSSMQVRSEHKEFNFKNMSLLSRRG